MSTYNIVNFIENNPISKLTDTYNNKLLQKIKETFTDDEQQTFIISFYAYLNYDDINDFVIDINDIWVWLDFKQKNNLKTLLKKNFKEGIDYKPINDLIKQKKEGRGGHNKETIFINIDTFKALSMIAGTTKATIIRKYYVKLEKILHDTIKEQSEEFKNQLIEKDKQILQIENKREQDRHSLLLNKFGNSGSLIYIIRIKSFDNGEYIVKIGESRRGVEGRVAEHKVKYEECYLLDCFPVLRSKDFEKFIHTHNDIKTSLVSNLKNHEGEKELFLIGKNLSYAMLINIINKNIASYDNSIHVINNLKLENDKLILENDKLKLENDKLRLENVSILNNKGLSNIRVINDTPNIQNNEIQELKTMNQQLLKICLELEKSNKEIIEKLNSSQIKTTTNFNEPIKNLGPRLQKINSDTLTIVKIYESVSEAIKENPKYKRSSINKAVKDNTIYYGFRWAFVDRELDANKIINLEPTKQIKNLNPGYIAKLDDKKTEILNVYLDRKTASKLNGYASDSFLDYHVKNGNITNGHYYVVYDSCSDELKKEFVKKNKGEPILYKCGVGQYDNNNNLVNEFVSKSDCCKSLGIGDKSLNKSIEKNIPYNGFYYKILENKIKCL
jgi:phage anti-repressor protein